MACNLAAVCILKLSGVHMTRLQSCAYCKTCFKANQGLSSPLQGPADQWANQYAADNAEGDWADQFANQFADGTDPNQWMEEFAQDMDARTAAAEAGSPRLHSGCACDRSV